MSLQTRMIPSPDGVKLWAQAAGNPSHPAIVFVHGFACSAKIFEKQFTDPEMLENLYMIRFDVRGHGRSDQPLEAESYESIHHAEDFNAVCAAFSVKKPFIAGWSLGGIMAADILAAYGEEAISGIILLDGLPYRSMHPEIVHPFVMDILPGLVSLDRDSFYETATSFALSCVAENYEIPTRDFFDMVLCLAIQHPLVRLHSINRAQDESALLAARHKLPMMAIHGIEDRHMWVDKMENFMQNNFEQAEFHRIAQAGHAPFYEQPQLVNKLILDFVLKRSLGP